MESKIHQTKDGSSTLYSEEFNQFYHNPNGAASESKHVFFEKPGVLSFLNNAIPISILEVGFGTGLNFLLLLDYLEKLETDIPVRFYSAEAFPVDAETAAQFDFNAHLHHPELNTLLPEIFGQLKPGFNHLKPLPDVDAELILYIGTFEDFKPDNLQADFIFHDPFSPRVNEELWTLETFTRLASFSKPTTVLSTYCAASKARAAMAVAGWKVARASGALGKREMTIAAMDEEKLTGFKRVNEQRLSERYLKGDFTQ